jgi:hypothetical protein
MRGEFPAIRFSPALLLLFWAEYLAKLADNFAVPVLNGPWVQIHLAPPSSPSIFGLVHIVEARSWRRNGQAFLIIRLARNVTSTRKALPWGVVAEAGTSRLWFEFRERCRSRGMRVYEGHAVAHGRNIPFLPVLELFRAYFGITLEDDDRGAREKIAGRMVLLDQSFAEALPLLFDFLGVSDPQRLSPRLEPEAPPPITMR